MDLLPTLALATMAIAIGIALWSKLRTEKKLDAERTEGSSLARRTPDPNFLPDPSVTDPNNLSGRR